jgi:hypothetical protein
VSTFRVVAGSFLVALAFSALAPAARADHGNGTERCNRAYEGTFGHLDNLPIRAPGTRERLGHLSLNVATLEGELWRTCAVVIRAHHKHRRFSGVRIKPAVAGDDRPWRRKANRSRWGAGPVVYLADCVRVRGTISAGTKGKAYCYDED